MIKMNGKMPLLTNPASIPFWAQIRHTSARAIIPTPILKESFKLNLQIKEPNEQPNSFPKIPAITNEIPKNSILISIASNCMDIPMFAKNTGVKII